MNSLLSKDPRLEDYDHIINRSKLNCFSHVGSKASSICLTCKTLACQTNNCGNEHIFHNMENLDKYLSKEILPLLARLSSVVEECTDPLESRIIKEIQERIEAEKAGLRAVHKEILDKVNLMYDSYVQRLSLFEKEYIAIVHKNLQPSDLRIVKLSDTFMKITQSNSANKTLIGMIEQIDSLKRQVNDLRYIQQSKADKSFNVNRYSSYMEDFDKRLKRYDFQAVYSTVRRVIESSLDGKPLENLELDPDEIYYRKLLEKQNRKDPGLSQYNNVPVSESVPIFDRMNSQQLSPIMNDMSRLKSESNIEGEQRLLTSQAQNFKLEEHCNPRAKKSIRNSIISPINQGDLNSSISFIRSPNPIDADLFSQSIHTTINSLRKHPISVMQILDEYDKVTQNFVYDNIRRLPALKSLEWDNDLANASQDCLEYLGEKGMFKDNIMFVKNMQRMTALHYPFTKTSPAFYKGIPDVKRIMVNLIFEEDGILFSSDYNLVGIACEQDETGKALVILNFGLFLSKKV